MFRVVDDSSVDRNPLGVSISAVWRIASLELAVRDSQTGKNYVVAQQASYPLRDQQAAVLDEGFWCFPNIAHPVQFSYSAPATEESLAKLIAENRNNFDLTPQIEQLAYSLGLRDVQYRRVPGSIEVKTSPRTPSLVKAFAIERYLVTAVDPSCLTSISDPECLAGTAFIPIDSPLDELTSLESRLHGRSHLVAWGKPLMTSLEAAVTTPHDVSRYRDAVINLDRELFFYRERGILVAADLAGYGRALQYAHQNMRSFGLTVEQNLRAFRERVTTSFERMAQRVGSTQQQLAGDGFLAGYPQRLLRDPMNMLPELIQTWLDVLSAVKQLNEAIDEPAMRVGSRLAIHYGDYSFGRVCGPINLRPVFDGGAVVDVARMEQGVAAWSKSQTRDELDAFRSSDGSVHIVALSRIVPLEIQDADAAHLKVVTAASIGSKEATHDVVLCSVEDRK